MNLDNHPLCKEIINSEVVANSCVALRMFLHASEIFGVVGSFLIGTLNQKKNTDLFLELDVTQKLEDGTKNVLDVLEVLLEDAQTQLDLLKDKDTEFLKKVDTAYKDVYERG